MTIRELHTLNGWRMIIVQVKQKHGLLDGQRQSCDTEATGTERDYNEATTGESVIILYAQRDRFC